LRIRPRRLRSHDSLRRLVRETSIGPDHLIAPMFVTRDYALARPIDGMPGCRILTLDEAGREAQAIDAAGLAGVLLFGVTGSKDEAGRQADAPGGPTAGAIAAIRAAAPRLSVWADVCLCGYTSHGHCGIVSRDSRGAREVDNDATLDRLARVAVACAQAGADVIAPSDMMDGRVRVIRDALDRAGQTQIAIASYAVKYASAFYGPFRGAAGSSPVEGDRRGYQMDPANAREAVRRCWTPRRAPTCSS
jgi:porphobilinogen synthase